MMSWRSASLVRNVALLLLASWPRVTALKLAATGDGQRQLALEVPELGGDSYFFQNRSLPALKEVAVAGKVLDAFRHADSGGMAEAMIVADLATGQLTLHLGSQGHSSSHAKMMRVAWARYNNTVDQNGWAHLSVTATDDPMVSEEVRMYAAGYLEGMLSSRQIRDFHHNTQQLLQEAEESHHAMQTIKEVFAAQAEGILHRTANRTLGASVGPSARWQLQARYALMQSWGILDAYNSQASLVNGTRLSMVDLLVLSSDGETPELETAFDYDEVALREDDAKHGWGSFLQGSKKRPRSPALPKSQTEAEALWRRIKESSGRCSALVRLAQGRKELLVGHSTFSDYGEMNRIFKYYNLPLHGAVARKIAFSSYPGVAGSTDDYYLTDSGLVVTETTISMLNDQAYDRLHDVRGLLPDFMRIMLATRLAKSGKEWVELMSQSATGLYSSQWMVVDYGKFEPKRPLQNGTLFVLEQMPGISHAQDMSQKLDESGYWASENRAWFDDVREASGSREMESLYGSIFSAEKNPRALIFAGTAPKVQTLAEMKSEMRRNQGHHETSLRSGASSPDHAIAARGDLADKPSTNGAVDAKVTSSCLARQLQCEAISGPTWDTQQPFRWTDDAGKELFPESPHDGQPDKWNFDWVRMMESGATAPSPNRCP